MIDEAPSDAALPEVRLDEQGVQLGATIGMWHYRRRRAPGLSANRTMLQYDVTADGERFLIDMTNASNAGSSPPLTMVTNQNG